MGLGLFEEAEVVEPEAAGGGGECGCSSDRKLLYKLAFWRFFSSKPDSSCKNDPKIISKRPLN